MRKHYHCFSYTNQDDVYAEPESPERYGIELSHPIKQITLDDLFQGVLPWYPVLFSWEDVEVRCLANGFDQVFVENDKAGDVTCFHEIVKDDYDQNDLATKIRAKFEFQHMSPLILVPTNKYPVALSKYVDACFRLTDDEFCSWSNGQLFVPEPRVGIPNRERT